MTITSAALCSLDAASFPATPSVTDSGHAWRLEDTYARVKALLRAVPITRVVNVTPLDAVSLPVWAAITPLARDLTVHAGKGRTALAAQLSAIMEAIERVCAECVAAERTHRASFEAMRNGSLTASVDPDDLNLPFNTAYTPNAALRWVIGHDLVRSEPVWVPLDVVVSPSEDGVCSGVETNGLAAGNTIVEATLHALYEVIERDAASIHHFCELHAEPTDTRAPVVRVVDAAGFPPETAEWCGRLAEHGLETWVEDLTSDLSVPVFGAVIVDRRFAGNDGQLTTFVGHGCDLDSRRALFRAVSEATQARSIVSLGARDTFEGLRVLPDRSARLRRRLDVLHPRSTTAFTATTEASGDLAQDLQRMVRRLAERGFRRVIVVELTRPDLGVPVVRVIVPGLEPPYGATTRRPGTRLLSTLV